MPLTCLIQVFQVRLSSILILKHAKDLVEQNLLVFSFSLTRKSFFLFHAWLLSFFHSRKEQFSNFLNNESSKKHPVFSL